MNWTSKVLLTDHIMKCFFMVTTRTTKICKCFCQMDLNSCSLIFALSLKWYMVSWYDFCLSLCLIMLWYFISGYLYNFQTKEFYNLSYAQEPQEGPAKFGGLLTYHSIYLVVQYSSYNEVAISKAAVMNYAFKFFVYMMHVPSGNAGWMFVQNLKEQ